MDQTRTSQWRIRAVPAAWLCGALLWAGQAQAQPTTGASPARTTVLDSIVFTNTADLNFGNAVPGATAGRVIINQNSGARTSTGGVTLAGGTPQRATFTVTGTPNCIVRLTIATGTITLSNGSGGTMIVNTFRLNGARNRNLGAVGTITVRVGGRLNVNANQAAGNYTGTFNLTVDYL